MHSARVQGSAIASAFNSLFEMRHAEDAAAVHPYPPFNSLFEMPTARSANVRSSTPKRSFNSLFEMRRAQAPLCTQLDTVLSILYLRCTAVPPLSPGQENSILSILYLRCATTSTAGSTLT